MDEQISKLDKRLTSVEDEVRNMHLLLIQQEVRILRTILITLLSVGGFVVLVKALH